MALTIDGRQDSLKNEKPKRRGKRFMIKREDSGKFAAQESENEGIGYYSKLLRKPFDSLKDLRKEEDEYRKKHEAELKEAEERKSEAKEIESLIKERDEIASMGLKRKRDAAEAYAKAEREARKAYQDECKAVEDANKDANAKLEGKLEAFCKKNPGGFHTTIKYDDGSTKTYSYNSSRPAAWDSLDALDLLDRLFRF